MIATNQYKILAKFEPEPERDLQRQYGDHRTFRPDKLVALWVAKGDGPYALEEVTISGARILKAGRVPTVDRQSNRYSAIGQGFDDMPGWARDLVAEYGPEEPE
jgi:hypothetical protein